MGWVSNQASGFGPRAERQTGPEHEADGRPGREQGSDDPAERGADRHTRSGEVRRRRTEYTKTQMGESEQWDHEQHGMEDAVRHRAAIERCATCRAAPH